MIALAAQKLSILGSILLYCPTPAQVLSNARVMLALLEDEEDVDWGNDPDWVRFVLVCKECEEDGVYLELAKKGILCHSAALKSDVRRFTEHLLRKGKAKYIYATNTLAQGVNLGVSIVIVVGTYIRPDTYLTNRDFWNMAGRAGRSYVDTEGKILFVCDCKDRETERKRIWVANQYLNSDSIDKVESGVYLWLRKLKEMQEKLDLDFDYLLQLIAENNLNDLGDAPYFFEMIDDSLLTLDLSYREDDKDDAGWVEDHFKKSLAVIQEELEEERQKNIAILKARVHAVRRMTQGKPMPQAFASSGIPLSVALYFEEHADRLNSLADEYLQSDRGIEDKINYFKHFDQLVDEIPTSRIIRFELCDLDQIREQWVKGDSLGYKQMSIAEKYYGYTFTWFMNALAARNALLEEDVYKDFYEEMSLIAQYGLPSKWAVQIYLCGISSRKVAAELTAKLDEPDDTSRLSVVARYIINHDNEIQANGNITDLAKEWVKTLLIRLAVTKSTIPTIPRFVINGTDEDMKYDRLLCKMYEGKPQLCSVDMKYHFYPEEKENMPFSKVADIPGVFFSRDGRNWNMECHNPYVEIDI